jgi:hypothetical protein
VGLSDSSLQERLLKHALRARFRFKQGRDRILFEVNTLGPEIAAMKAGKPYLGLEAGELFDMEIVDDDAGSDQA